MTVEEGPNMETDAQEASNKGSNKRKYGILAGCIAAGAGILISGTAALTDYLNERADEQQKAQLKEQFQEEKGQFQEEISSLKEENSQLESEVEQKTQKENNLENSLRNIGVQNSNNVSQSSSHMNIAALQKGDDVKFGSETYTLDNELMEEVKVITPYRVIKDSTVYVHDEKGKFTIDKEFMKAKVQNIGYIDLLLGVEGFPSFYEMSDKFDALWSGRCVSTEEGKVYQYKEGWVTRPFSMLEGVVSAPTMYAKDKTENVPGLNYLTSSVNGIVRGVSGAPHDVLRGGINTTSALFNLNLRDKSQVKANAGMFVYGEDDLSKAFTDLLGGSLRSYGAYEAIDGSSSDSGGASESEGASISGESGFYDGVQ